MIKLIRNLIAFVVLNAWLITTGKGYVSYCPKCGNASALSRFGMKHCDFCGYHEVS